MPDFLDKVKQSVGKGVTTVSVKSKEMVETAKLKSQVGELEHRRKEALEELGNIAYTMFLKDTFAEERLKAKCAGIFELDNQIKEKQKELAEVHTKAQEALGKPKAVGVCACGTEIYENAKFCGKCGAKLASVHPVAES